MKKLMLMVVGLAIATSALFAAPIACPFDAAFSSVVALGSTGCASGDALFSNFAGNLPANWDISIYTDDFGDYTVEFSNAKRNPLVAGTYHISYNILVKPDLTTTYLSTASLSADVNPFKADHPSSLTAQLTDYYTSAGIGTLATQRDVADTTTLTKGIHVTESVTAGGIFNGRPTSSINHFTNTFQTLVPEPATMAMVGFSPLIAGGVWRRKQRVR